MKLRRIIKIAAVAAVAAIGLSFLTACSAKAYPDQCALIVGSGAGDAHQVKKVFLPGEKVQKGDDQSYFLPCGDRNYQIQTHNGDDPDTTYLSGTTQGDTDTPGIPVKVQLSMYFSLNQDRNSLKEFWGALCRKYSCASTHADQGDQSSTRSSTPGWLTMLRENFTPALERATRQAVSNFKPNLWQQQGQAEWPKLAQDISADFMQQIQGITDAKHPFFCATASGAGKCKNVGIQINRVDPADPAVISIYNQGIQQDQQKSLNSKRVEQAKQLYGNDWAYYLGLQDTIKECEKVSSCNVILGQSGSTPAITVPSNGASPKAK